MEIKIRFNTEKNTTDVSLPAWRILLDGIEHLAEDIKVYTPCWTSVDEIAPGIIKWHISCSGVPHWDAELKTCTITAR